MFCPEGYLSLMDVRQHLYRLMRAHMAELMDYRNRLSSAPTSERVSGASLNRWTGVEFENWLISEFIWNCPFLYVASPDGLLLEIHRTVGRAISTNFDFLDQNPYLYIHKFSWTLDIDRHLNLIEKAGPILEVKFGVNYLDTIDEDHFSLDDPEFWEYMDLRAILRSTDLARVLRPFHGWALCIGPEDFPNDIAFLPELQNAQDESNVSPRALGRKRHLRDAVLAAYMAIYAEGHGAINLGIVHRRVQERSGREFSRETLERAIEEAENIRRMQAERLQKPT